MVGVEPGLMRYVTGQARLEGMRRKRAARGWAVQEADAQRGREPALSIDKERGRDPEGAEGGAAL